MRNSLRLRITAWYLAFFSVLFAGFGVFLYRVLATGLEQRLDQSLAAQADTAAALFAEEFRELHDIRSAAQEAVSEVRHTGGVIAIFEGGRVVAASSAAAARPPEAHAATRPVNIEGVDYAVVAWQGLDSISASLRLVRRVLFFALPVLLSIAALGGYWLATRGLAPLAAMAGQARRITSSNLETRIEIGRASAELSGLADSFNELLGRLDRSFESMRRFVADASHELRTPLAVIRGEADLALSQNRSPAEYRQTLAIIQDESRRLSLLVEDLLNLARADAGRVLLQVEEFYFNDLLADCCRRVQAAASASGIELLCVAPNDLPFRGDEQLLRRLVGNLLDNAIRYTPRGGRVTAIIEAEAGGVRLRVSDTGMGIPADAAAHLFERFYRADPARSRAEGGFGLGLSIVKWIAESHHGTVSLDRGAESGATFTVTLPR